jgi:hypothetical protein
MSAATKRRFPTWQQALFLLVFGVIVGYPSCIEVGHGVWGGGSPQYQGFYVFCFFLAAVAFLAGFVSFVSITVKALVSPAQSTRYFTPAPHSATAPISPATHPDLFLKAPAQLQTTIVPSHVGAALLRLRIALIAMLVLVFIYLGPAGPYRLTTRYGRYLFLNATLAFLVSALPYVIALLRTWRVPDRAGLALAMVAGFVQVLTSWFLTDSRVRTELPKLATLASVGLLVLVLAYLAWRNSPTRTQDVGLLISVFFGVLAYTTLAQIGLAILVHREQLWRQM